MAGRDSLGGATVVIGCGGIGSAVIAKLAGQGIPLVAADLDYARAEASVANLPTEALAHSVDVTDEASVAALIAQAHAAFGGVTRLVYTAGIIYTGNFLELSPRQWRRTFEVNLTGAFCSIQATARHLIENNQHGRMVMVASVAGRGPRADSSDYAASKAGLISLVRSAAASLAAANIQVNAVCPGVVDTPMTYGIHRQRAARRGISVEESLAGLADTIPLGRIESPREVAEVIWFLLSDAASYITGQALNVCGGLAFD